MSTVYKAGRRLPQGNGISSLLANRRWSLNYLQGEKVVTQTEKFCARRTPLFMSNTVEAAIEAATLPVDVVPAGTVIEVWEAETPEVHAPPSWIPHPGRATPEWFLFWQSIIDFKGCLRIPYPEIAESYFHRCPVPAHTLLCFELVVLTRVCMVLLQRVF